MSNDQFTKLFSYIQDMRSDIDRRFDEVDSRIDIYSGAVDAFAKQTETYMQEMLLLSHKVDHLEQKINS